MESQWLIAKNLKRNKTKFLVAMTKCLKANTIKYAKLFAQFKRNGIDFGPQNYSVPPWLQKSCRRIKSDTPSAFEFTEYGREFTQILLVIPTHVEYIYIYFIYSMYIWKRDSWNPRPRRKCRKNI